MKAIKIKNVVIPEDKLLQWVLAHLEDAELIDWEPSVKILDTKPSRQALKSIKRSTDIIDDEF